MGTGKYYNPVLKARIASFFENSDWVGLVECLKGLSVKDFRMANELIGDVFLPLIKEEDFWMAFHHLMSFHSRAFLVTMLKTVPCRVQKGMLSLHHNGFLVVSNYLCSSGTEVDRLKVIVHMENAFCDKPEEITHLFLRMRVENPREKLDYLLRGEGMGVFFLLLITLRQLEHDRALLIRTAHFLMKRGDAYSFNLASLLRTYFDLQEVKGTFSLNLNPYELSRIDTSYETFCRIMKSI